MFLATTALSEFWDKDQEILFLGYWCLCEDRRDDWEGLKFTVMPCPWNDRDRFYNAARYLDRFYELMLQHLTDYLNSIQGISRNQRYWRILIGPWLFHYLHAFYDRYIHLNEALASHPELKTIALDPRFFRTPRDTVEFIDFIAGDLYNLQIFSQILEGVGFVFPTRVFGCATQYGEPGVSDKKRDVSVKGLSRWSRRVARESLNRIWMRVCKIGLCDMYCSRSELRALIRRTGLRAQPLDVSNEWLSNISSPALDQCRSGFTAIPAAGEFERIFVQSLKQNFPTLYLEAYPRARAEVLRRCPRIPPVLTSLVGWYFDEAFKFFAAEAAAKGGRLVAIQHGGGYGISPHHPHELHESRVADAFLVWGWANSKGKPYRNLPSPKLSSLLSSRPRKSRSYGSEAIVFVGTAHPRYLFRFHSAPVGSQWENYFEWQLRFLSAVSDRIRSAILVRPYMQEYGYGIRRRISRRFADIQWDDDRPFQQTLKETRVVVIDHCDTTFLEVLAGNIPTLLFWDPERWEPRDEAYPYFEGLRKVGILWDSPEAAAIKLAQIYDEPWAWWGSGCVQEVRERFVEHYALAREDWLDCWASALEEEVVLGHLTGNKKARSSAH